MWFVLTFGFSLFQFSMSNKTLSTIFLEFVTFFFNSFELKDVFNSSNDNASLQNNIVSTRFSSELRNIKVRLSSSVFTSMFFKSNMTLLINRDDPSLSCPRSYEVDAIFSPNLAWLWETLLFISSLVSTKCLQ